MCDAQDGSTALIWAAQNGHTSAVAVLIEKGASVDQADMVSCHGLSSFSAGPDPVDVFACCAEP